MKESLHIIAACAARCRAFALLQRSKRAQTVISCGWKRLIGTLHRAAAHAFVDIGCLLLSNLGGRDEWLPGQLTFNSLKQTMDFVHNSSSADERLGPKRVFLDDSPHISFKCVSVAPDENALGRCFDVYIDLLYSKMIFRFQSYQDALDVHICLMSYLLFRGMIHHLSAQHLHFMKSDRSPGSMGAQYAKMRLKLLRSITLFLAYKSTVKQTSAADQPSSFPAAGASASTILRRVLGNRKVENRASQLVSYYSSSH
jgi:hypothetical protein